MIKTFYAKKKAMSQAADFNSNIVPITELKVLQSFFYKLKKDRYNSCTVVTGAVVKNKLAYTTASVPEKAIVQKLQFMQQYDPIFFWDFIFIGSQINVQNSAIGKGFCGGIKRHGFKRGPQSHGSKHNRLQGSLGAGTTPGRVFPGKKMSGRVGTYKKTTKNLLVLDLNQILNVIKVNGSIPGNLDTVVTINKH